MAEVLVALAGIGLILLAIALTQSWFDHHLLPSFYLMRRWYVFLESSSRVALALMGVFLLLVARPRIGRLAVERPSAVIAGAIAAVLAIGAGQLALSWRHPSTEWLLASVEPLRRPDPRLGWTFVPSREGHKTIGGRTISFAFDAAGYRVRRVNEPVDPARPTILFAGESVMLGEGLNWDETIPAQVGALMEVQSANLAVHGYATDQSVPARRIRTAALSAARRARHALHDRAPRPEPRRQPPASRTGIGLAASCAPHAADVARDAHRAVSPRDDGRARHCGDV